MRAFIAIDLPDDIKLRLEKVIRVLRRSHLRLSLVNPENLHMTLKFLGEIDSEQAVPIGQRLDIIARQQEVFSLSLTDFGFFPPRGTPRVLYVGTNQQQRLTELARQLDEQLAPMGFPSTDRFTPHITISRIKDNVVSEQIEILINESFPEGTFPVSSFALYCSTLHQRGVHYELLHRPLFSNS